MPSLSEILVSLKFIVDKASQESAKQAVEELGRLGVEWNEKAQRYQMSAGTGSQAGKFVSAENVSRMLVVDYFTTVELYYSLDARVRDELEVVSNEKNGRAGIVKRG